MNWYVAKSKPQKEQWLVTCLTHLGVETSFPKFVQLKRGLQLVEPVFPGYVFCHVDPQSPNWPLIRWAPGLAYFLGVDGYPVPISTALVDHIRNRVDLWNTGGYRGGLQKGDKVAFTRGPFAGLEGIFAAYVPARRRCRILLQVVGRLTPVEVPDTDVEHPLLRFTGSVADAGALS